MKKFVVAAVAATSVVCLSACANDSPTPVVTVTAVPTQSPSEPVPSLPSVPSRAPQSPAAGSSIDGTGYSSAEELLISAYEQEYGDMYAEGEQALLSLGYTVCKYAPTGDWTGIAYSLVKAGFEKQEAGFILGASVAALCPSYRDSLVGWANSDASTV